MTKCLLENNIWANGGLKTCATPPLKPYSNNILIGHCIFFLKTSPRMINYRHFDITYNTLINEILLGSFRTIIYAALVGEKWGRVSQKKAALLGKVHLNIHKRAKHCFGFFSPQLLLQKIMRKYLTLYSNKSHKLYINWQLKRKGFLFALRELPLLFWLGNSLSK